MTLPALSIPTYVVIILLVAVYALFMGFRRGIVRQMAGVLGFTFGIVVAYFYSEPVYQWLLGWLKLNPVAVWNDFGLHILANALIFTGVYVAFYLSTPIWKAVTAWHSKGILGSIAGALFALLKYMTGVSLAMNIMLASSADRKLLNKAADNDGNLCSAVLLLAPALMSTEDVIDLHNHIQVEEAGKISMLRRNLDAECGVYLLNTNRNT